MNIEQYSEAIDSLIESQKARDVSLDAIELYEGEYDGREVPNLKKYGLGPEIKELVVKLKEEWIHTIPVVMASTGSGKSTLVSYYAATGKTLVITPFRVAALNLISWARQNQLPGFGIAIGGVVKNVEKSQILVCTADYLIHRNDILNQADLFIFDEMHIANPAMVNLMSWADLRKKPVIGLSATFNPKSYSVRRPFKVFDREVRPFPIKSTRIEVVKPLETVVNLIEKNLEKNILVFCPGENMIDKIMARVKERAVYKFKSGVDTMTIPGIGLEADTNFCIASTNALETAVTVRGLDMVIDFGLEKSPTWDDYVFSLPVRPITSRSSTQRRGRVGREKPGEYVLVTTKGWQYSEESEVQWGWLQDVEQAGSYFRIGIGTPSPKAKDWYLENRQWDSKSFPTSLLYSMFVNKMDARGAGLSALAYVTSLEMREEGDYRIYKKLVKAYPEATLLSDTKDITFEDVRSYFGHAILAGRDPRGEKVESGDGAFVTMFRNDGGKISPVGFIPGKVETEEMGDGKFLLTVVVLTIMFLISNNWLSYACSTIGLLIAWFGFELYFLIPCLLLQVLSFPMSNATLMSVQLSINWRLSAQLIGMLGIFIPIFSYTIGFKKGMSDSSVWSYVTKKTYEQARAFLAGFPSAKLMKRSFPVYAFRGLVVLIAVGVVFLVMTNPLEITFVIPWTRLLDIPPTTIYLLVLWSLLGWYCYVKGYNAGVDYGVTMMANADFSKSVEKYSQAFGTLVDRLSWQGIIVLVFMVVVCVGLASVVTSVKQMSAVSYDDSYERVTDIISFLWSGLVLVVPLLFVKMRIGTDEQLVWRSIRALTGKCTCIPAKKCEICKISNYDNYLDYLSRTNETIHHTVGFPSDLVVEHAEECKAYCITQLDLCASDLRFRVREVPSDSKLLRSTIEAIASSQFQAAVSQKPELLKAFIATDLLNPCDLMGEARKLLSYAREAERLRREGDEAVDPTEAYVQKADALVLRHLTQFEDGRFIQNTLIPDLEKEFSRAVVREANIRTENKRIDKILQEIVELKKMEGFCRQKYQNILTFLTNQGVNVTTKPSFVNFPQIVTLPNYGTAVQVCFLSFISFLGFWSLFSFSASFPVLATVLVVTIAVTLVRGLYSTYRLEIAFGRQMELNVSILFSRGFVVYKGHSTMPILTKSNILPPPVKVSDLSVWLEILISVVLLMWYSGFKLYGVSYEIEGMASSILDFLPNLIEGVKLYPVANIMVPHVLRTLSCAAKNPDFFKPEFDSARMSISSELVKIAMRGETLGGFNSLFPGLSQNVAVTSLDPNVRLLSGRNFDVDLGSNCRKLFEYSGHTASKPSVGCDNPVMEFAASQGYAVGHLKNVMYTTTGDALDNRYAYRYRRGQGLVPFSSLDMHLATLSVYQIISHHNPAEDGEFWTLGNPLKMSYKNKAAVGLRLRSRFPGKTKEYMNSSEGITDLLSVYENILLGRDINVHWSASNKVENKEVKEKLDPSMTEVCRDYLPEHNNFVRIFVFTDRAFNQCGATVFDPFFATFKKRHAKYGVAVATPVVGESTFDTSMREHWYDENKPLAVNVKYLFERDSKMPHSHVVLSEDVKHWDGSQSAGKLLLMSLLAFMNYDYSSEEEFMKTYRIWGAYTRERIFSVMVLMDGTVVHEYNCQNSGDIYTTGSNTLGNLFDNMYLNHAAYANRTGFVWDTLERRAEPKRIPVLMQSSHEFEWQRSMEFSRKIRLYGAGDNFLVAFPNLRGVTKIIKFRADPEVLKLLNRNIKEGEGGLYYNWRGCEFFSQILSSFSAGETDYITLDSPVRTMIAKGWHLKKPLKYHKGKLHRESQMKLAGFLISYMFLSVPRKNLFEMYRCALNHFCYDVLNVDVSVVVEDDYWSLKKYESLLKYKVGNVTQARMYEIRFGSPVVPGGDDILPPTLPSGEDL